MKRRVLCFVTVFVFLSTLFVGCAKSPAGSNTTSSKTTTEVKLPKYTITGDTVTLLCWSSQSDVTSETGGYYNANELMKQNYNCSLKIIRTTYPELPTKAAALVLSGNAPDLIFYKDQDFPTFIKNNIVAETSQYTDFNDPLWSSLKDTYKLYSYQGKQYFMPFNEIYTDSYVYFWTSYFTDAGLETPLQIYQKNPNDWTLSKLQEVMKEVTQDTNHDGVVDIYGLTMHPGEMYMTTGEDFAKLDPVTGKYSNNLRSTAFNEYMNFFFNTNSDGDNTRLMALNHINDFEAKKAVMMWAQVWPLGTLAKQINDGEIGFVVSPKVAEGNTWYVKGRVDGYWVGKGCANPGGAAAFIACNAYMSYNKDYKAQMDAKNKQVFGWSDQTLALMKEFNDHTKFKPMLFTAYGLPEWGNTYQYNLWSDVALFSGSWSASVEKYYPILQAEIDSVNNGTPMTSTTTVAATTTTAKK